MATSVKNNTLPIPSSLHPGLLNLAGSTPESTELLKALLSKDVVSHHCYFDDRGFHNHLSHHLLAAYDVGTPTALLQAMYDEEEKEQRPMSKVTPPDIVFTEENWTSKLGDPRAYEPYLHFFSTQVAQRGAADCVIRYVFSEVSNAKGIDMLARFVNGALHPIIHVGYGIEFGSNIIVAAGLAQTAIHEISSKDLYTSLFSPPTPNTNTTGLDVLKKLYSTPSLDSSKLFPYEPGFLFSQRAKTIFGGPEGAERIREIVEICKPWAANLSSSTPAPTHTPSKELIDDLVKESICFATFIACGTSRPTAVPKPPRIDFFLMHGLTSSLFLPTLLGLLRVHGEAKQAYGLLQAWLRTVISSIVLRGTPRVDLELVTNYTGRPHPGAVFSSQSHLQTQSKLLNVASPLGDPASPYHTNPWPRIIHNCLHHPDPHVLKSIRTLYYAATHYGLTPLGSFSRPEGVEGIKGLDKVDGTIFVRAAGALLSRLGWAAELKDGEKLGSWDRSALGWDEAWEGEL